MKEHPCELCGKVFKQKCHWVNHTQNKKYSCVLKLNTKKDVGAELETEAGANIKLKNNLEKNNLKCINVSKLNNNVVGAVVEVLEQIAGAGNEANELYLEQDKSECKFTCKYCFKEFLYNRNLNKHIKEERCEVLKLQNQQKENIFINLLEEEKIVNQTKKELGKISKSKEIIMTDLKEHNLDQMSFLIQQIEILNKKLDEQKKESEEKQEKFKSETEMKIKLMTNRYTELEKNNVELKKTNEKLQNKVNKIVNKNKITNNTDNSNTNTNTNSNNNITNTVINNPVIKLVNFGSEDLNKISHNVFIDTIRSQGAGLYNKAIEGIHFNKDHPENQNIYISDINRGKVMIYKDEKWFLDNWDNIYHELLEQIIQFGYDKNDFFKDCGYKVGDIKYNKQMIKNGLRWYKLLDGDEDDVEYFQLDPDDRPEIDQETYNDYVEMYNFRKKHPKKQTEKHIKDKIKLNMYNKREIPIENYKKIEDMSKKVLLIE